jgi:hypothetical protein
MSDKKRKHPMSDSSKLADAAEALVQAALSETNSSMVAMNREVVQGIQSIAADLKGRNDDKALEALGVLNGKVDTLSSNISQMHVTMKTQEKLHRIEFALGHCDLGTFVYYSDSDRSGHRSEELVKNILLIFRQGFGYNITLGMTLTESSYRSSNEEKLASNQKFRDALTAQLFTLLGVPPVWDAQPKEDGRRVIRYPVKS